MPEFLANSNRYHLGVKQDGEPLNDVLLPPWAKVLRRPLRYQQFVSLQNFMAFYLSMFFELSSSTEDSISTFRDDSYKKFDGVPGYFRNER